MDDGHIGEMAVIARAYELTKDLTERVRTFPRDLRFVLGDSSKLDRALEAWRHVGTSRELAWADGFHASPGTLKNPCALGIKAADSCAKFNGQSHERIDHATSNRAS